MLRSFSRKDSNASISPPLILPSSEYLGVTSTEYSNITEAMNLVGSEKRSRVRYKEVDKLKIAKYANEHGSTKAINHFKHDFPKLSESTIRPWLQTYREKLKNNISHEKVVISRKRGRPLSLPVELDSKLQTFLLNLRRAGGNVNKHVVLGVLMGLIRSDLVVFGSYIDFCVTKSWLQHLYRRMNFTRRMVTTSRPVVTKSIYDAVKTKYLHDIVSVCLEYQIPDELIINIDQTPSRYVSTDRVTMAQKGTKHVSRKGSNDKRAITVTYAETLAGDILPFQLIYKGKTVRSLPKVEFPKGFLLEMNDSHWSNETETLKLLDKVVSPYLKKKKVELKLPESQKSCIIWDAFGAHRTDSVISKLEVSGIEAVGVPKNLTHLLQPLDLTINSATKKIEKRQFSEYFNKCITNSLQRNPKIDVTTIEVDLRLSTLKPLHAATTTKVYEYLKSENGKKIILAGWTASGITGALKEGREGKLSSLNPFHR